MPYVNVILDENKWLLQSKYNLDTLYIILYVIGWEFSINRNVILLILIFKIVCIYYIVCIGRTLSCIIKFLGPVVRRPFSLNCG